MPTKYHSKTCNRLASPPWQCHLFKFREQKAFAFCPTLSGWPQSFVTLFKGCPFCWCPICVCWDSREAKAYVSELCISFFGLFGQKVAGSTPARRKCFSSVSNVCHFRSERRETSEFHYLRCSDAKTLPTSAVTWHDPCQSRLWCCNVNCTQNQIVRKRWRSKMSF